MARTMSDEQEREIRRMAAISTPTASVPDRAALLHELDDERAAHEATRIGSYSAETMEHMVEECDRLKARLALAEAVCESCGEDWDEEFGGFDLYDHDALAAWRAGKC